SELGADVADLPPPAAVLLRFADDAELTVADLMLLPPRFRETAYDRMGRQLVTSREFGKALALYNLQHDQQSDFRASPAPLANWETETLSSTAEWSKLGLPRDPDPRRASQPFERLCDFVFPAEVVRPDLISAADVEAKLLDALAAMD